MDNSINGGINNAGINNAGMNKTGLDAIDKLRQNKHDEGERVTGTKALDQDDFLSLLTKQLSQQDPSDPVDNDKMIAQMTSFSTLTGINQINDQLSTLSTSLTSNQALQASTLVGQEVLVSNSTLVKGESGEESLIANMNADAKNAMIRIESEAGELVRTIDAGNLSAGEHRLSWDGLNDNGESLPAGSYKVIVEGDVGGKKQTFPVSTFANVNSVVLGSGDGSVLLNIEGMSKPISIKDVKEIG